MDLEEGTLELAADAESEGHARRRGRQEDAKRGRDGGNETGMGGCQIRKILQPTAGGELQDLRRTDASGGVMMLNSF